MASSSSRRGPHPQAGVVPYRWDSGRRVFCLITDSAHSSWILPKGMVDPGETPPETALKEAWEEAGIRGRLLGPPLGSYEYTKGSHRLIVETYLMEIDEVLSRWPEVHWRHRIFCTADEALRQLGRPDQIRMLQLALRRLAQTDQNSQTKP